MKRPKISELDETLTNPESADEASTLAGPSIDVFKERMKRLVKRVGGIAEVGRKTGIPESTIKKWVDGVSDPSRLRLFVLSRGTETSLLWLTAGEGPELEEDVQAATQRGSQSVRHDVLTVAIQLAEEALEGKTLPVEKRAELVGIIYELLDEGLPNAKVLRFARAAIK